jgi:hypothetical protein
MEQAQDKHSATPPILRRFAQLLAGIAITGLLPTYAYSVELEVPTTVTRLYSYSGGDVVIQVANPPSQCVAFWLRPTDAGFRNSYALLLSAYHTQVIVRFGAEDTQLWTGSFQPHCRITFAALD